MDAIQRAKNWLKEPLPDNGQPEPKEISAFRNKSLIHDLPS